MDYLFKDPGNAEAGEILAFFEEASKACVDAEVPATCLPVLTEYAGCVPRRNGKGERVFLFRQIRPSCSETSSCERLSAVLVAVILSPVFLAVAAMIYVFDGAPVFFVQERYGLGGRPFRLFKFRTMVRRSEDLHGKLQQALGQDGRLFKLTRDPRVTRTGGFLRRTFLDELPQLFNVMRGEMRFIGPRPLPASDQCHYTKSYHVLRLKGLPGMTGLWQVAGRNARTFDEMCLLDYYSICSRSVAMDLHILCRTFCLMFKQIGLKGKAERAGQ
jgi:lipopolysaccharide/colanic/teichoic acid biosynthesis glycosyltransferase